MLDTLYGEYSWQVPLEKGYHFKSLIGKSKMERNNRELPYMFRFYHKNGSIDVPGTIRHINGYYLKLTGKNLTELPPDDEDFLK